MGNVFFELGAIIIITTLVAYLARLFKQPLIPAYILAGLILGPWLGLVTDLELIRTTSEIGVALLLFIVGLEMNLKKLKHVSLVSSLGGTLQTVLVFFAGFYAATLFGIFTRIEAVYIGLILAFSSTMVVIKLLSDKKQIDTLHGRIVIGVLLTQDIIAILALSILTTVNSFSLSFLAIAFVKGAVVFLIAYIFRGAVFPIFFKYAAKSSEVLFLLAVTMCFFFSMLFTYFGFTIAIGAFVAGVAMANLPYTIEIIARVKSLRDFFATIFFVSLGLELSLIPKQSLLMPLLAFFLIAVLLKPIVIMFICSFFGYKKRPAFLSSISLSQISEFSLIIVAQGLFLGHISEYIFSIVVVLAISTLTLTSYFIDFDNKIYRRLSKSLSPFDSMSKGHELEHVPEKLEKDVILCGYDRLGYMIFEKLKKIGKKVLIIDFNPVIIRKLISQEVPCIYGDVGDVEVLEKADLASMKMLVSTIPSREDGLLLIRKTKEVNKRAIIFLTANTVDDALELYDAGAD